MYNERLDSLISMISVKQTVVLIEWRSQYEQDSKAMDKQLSEIADLNKEIWRAIRQLPTIEDIILILKRDVLESESSTQLADNQGSKKTKQSLDPLKNRIIDIAEGNVLERQLEKPPAWLIAADEITLDAEPIDTEGMTKIFVGE